MRSLITASCAAVNATRTPKLKRLARKATVRAWNAVAMQERRSRSRAAATIGLRRDMRAAAEPARTPAGSWPCSPSEYASRPNPEFDVIAAARRMSAPGEPDVDAQDVPNGSSRRATERVDDPHQRRAQPGRAELGRAVRAGNADSATSAIRTYTSTTAPMRGEEAARQVDVPAARLLREVRDRLEAGVREHRERQRERERVPRRLVAEREALARARAARRGDEAEHDEQQLGHEVEQRHEDPEPVELRAAQRAARPRRRR